MSRARLVRGAVAAALLGPLLSLTALPSASAANNSWPYVLLGGVSGQNYYVNGSALDWDSEIYSAKWLWGDADAGVAWAKTTNSAYSRMDIYQSSSNGAYLGYCAGVFQYYGSSVWDPWTPPTHSWTYGKILMSGDYGTCVGTHDVGALVHEMGHVMALYHSNPGATAIMRADLVSADLPFGAPKLDDINDVNGIKFLY